jgi:HPt (histidine-containing phosphotransfer) domain-containing protein
MNVKIDNTLLQQTFAGNAMLISKTMALFIKTVPDIMTKLELALQASDSAGVQLHAHSIKGSVGYFTKEEPYTTSFELEKLGRSGITPENKEQVTVLTKQLAEELDAIMELMKAYA